MTRVYRPSMLVLGAALALGLFSCQIAAPTARESQQPQTPAAVQPAPASAPVALPNRDGSLKFIVFGDFGTGSKDQYALANQMAKLHDTFPFELPFSWATTCTGPSGRRISRRSSRFRTRSCSTAA
jgi:hypothetical protein